MNMDVDEFPDEEWVEDEGGEEDDLLLCPSCHQSVHEDTQQCPHCGDWIIPVYPQGGWKRPVWVIAALMVVAAFLIMAVF